jgi:hypothetical protein
MAPLLALLLWPAPSTDASSILESAYAKRDFALSADPQQVECSKAPRVIADRDYLSHAIRGKPIEVRSRWTKENLYLLYICPYAELNLKPNPDPNNETSQLWNWEVAEAFIGSDKENRKTDHSGIHEQAYRLLSSHRKTRKPFRRLAALQVRPPMK